MSTREDQSITPDHVVIKTPQTAKDLFVMAMQGNPGNLAAAVSTKPGEHYILTVNIQMRFQREDVLAMLREAGYQVDFPGGPQA